MANRVDETWHRLREWTYGQAQSERLAGQLLLVDEFESVDPSHPLGGKDGGKDNFCQKGGKNFVSAVYFPRGQKPFSRIKKKFKEDLAVALEHDPDGFVFITNQELKLAERKTLTDGCDLQVELYHLERVQTLLDSPSCYGIRLQYLELEMTKDEQVSLFDYLHKTFSINLKQGFEQISDALLGKKKGLSTTPRIKTNPLGAGLIKTSLLRCKACNKRFEVHRTDKLIPSLGSFSFLEDKVDCPFCGSIEDLDEPSK